MTPLGGRIAGAGDPMSERGGGKCYNETLETWSCQLYGRGHIWSDKKTSVYGNGLMGEWVVVVVVDEIVS